MSVDLADVARDPEFLALPIEEQRTVLQRLDPDFNTLAEPEQAQVLYTITRPPEMTALERVGATVESIGRGIHSIPGAPTALNILTAPGDYTRGLLTGQLGRVTPGEFVGSEQRVASGELSPLQAVIRETGASFLDPLVALPALPGILQGARAARPAVAPAPIPRSATIPQELPIQQRPPFLIPPQREVQIGIPTALVSKPEYVDFFTRAGWAPEQAHKFADAIERPVWYHGSDVAGAKAIQNQGYIGGYQGRTWITPSKEQAEEFAKRKGGKVFEVNRSDIPQDLLTPENIETTTGAPVISLPDTAEGLQIQIPLRQATEAARRTKPVPGPITPIMPATEGIFSKPLKAEVHKELIEEAIPYFKEHPEAFHPELTVADNVGREFLRGNISREFLVEQYGIPPEELIGRFRGSIREAAQKMAYHSRLSHAERQALTEAGGIDEVTALKPAWKRLDNIRRALLVSQLSTAMRNFEVQVGRVGLDVLQAPIDAAMQRLLRRPATVSPFDGLQELLQIVTRGTKQEVEAILSKFPHQRERLLLTYSSDIDLPKAGIVKAEHAVLKGAEEVAHAVNIFNRTQEYLVRRGVFDARLAQRLAKDGIDLDEVITNNTVGAIPEAYIRDAVDGALEITFASTPKYGSAAHAFVDVINKVPGATLLIPFPRFMVNSFKFLYNYSPAGILRFLSPTERAAFAKGDVNIISRASLGSAVLWGAKLLRESEYAGERWYEAKNERGDTIDLRPFNPFAAYLFAADVYVRARDGRLDTLTVKDLAMGVLSTNLRAGTGLFILDQALAGLTSIGDIEKALRGLKGLAGETVAGFLTPLRQVIDVLGETDRDYRISRETKLDPFTGKLKDVLPGLRTTLPEAASPTRGGPPEAVHPAVKQLTGVRFVGKTPVERELDRLGFTRSEVLQMTGDPVVDRRRAQIMGPLVEHGLTPVLDHPTYQQLTEVQKGLVMQEMLRKLRPSTKVAQVLSKNDVDTILKRYPRRQEKVLREILP